MEFIRRCWSNSFGQLWSTRRRLIFTYDIAILVLLLLIGFIYAKYLRELNIEPSANAKSWTLLGLLWIPPKYHVFANCMWLGALGGVVVSLKGVYENAGEPPWSNTYNLWHLGRPFSGAVTGLITVFIFLFLTQTGNFSRPAVYLAAFVLGTQEARFFTFLFEIGRILVQVPPSMKEATGLGVTAVEPVEGRTGAVLILAGQGFETRATVKLGGVALDHAVVAPDGRSVAGVVPDLGGVARPVDITVLNPNGTSVVLENRFRIIV